MNTIKSDSGPIQNQNLQMSSQQTTDRPSKTNGAKNLLSEKPLAIIILIFIFVALFIGGFLLFRLSSITDKQSMDEFSERFDTPGNECGEFPDMLDACTNYTCEFTNPTSGEKLMREISGINNNLCIYSEEAPGGYVMECKLSEEERKVIAQYYDDYAILQFLKTDSIADTSIRRKVINKTYELNGKIINNPLEEAVKSGLCVVLSK